MYIQSMNSIYDSSQLSTNSDTHNEHNITVEEPANCKLVDHPQVQSAAQSLNHRSSRDFITCKGFGCELEPTSQLTCNTLYPSI